MNKLEKSRLSGNFLNILLILCIGVIEAGIIILMVKLFSSEGQASGSIFNNLASALILGWIGILIAYFAWAIYFYNINFGLTNTDWAKIDEIKEEDPEFKEPDENPHKTETLGLPPGTVRGTLTLSLVIGALAMIISSFGKNDTLPANQIFIDNWEFFKTAFLMMIAFYFGSKSLEKINTKKIIGKEKEPEDNTTDDGNVNFNDRI